MVAQARARAEAIAKQFTAPTTQAPASTNDAAAAAVAAARAIAARLAANAPK